MKLSVYKITLDKIAKVSIIYVLLTASNFSEFASDRWDPQIT